MIGKRYKENDSYLYELNHIKGIGKEYYNDGEIIFEGEYLNSIRNGKGKEYYLIGDLKFEALFLYDKKWESKGYNRSNNLIYELKDGKGLIIEYDIYGLLRFEGEYLNGEKNGKGKKYDKYNAGLTFEGGYLNGKRNWKGKEYDYGENLIKGKEME